MSPTTEAQNPRRNPLGPSPYVTRDEVADHLRASSAQMTRLAGTAGFPTPVLHLGKKTPRWLLSDIVAWIAAGGVDIALQELGELDTATQALFSKPARRRTPKSKRSVA